MPHKESEQILPPVLSKAVNIGYCKPSHFIVMVLTSFVIFISAAQARDFYVAKTGSDSNNGSADSPFLTINKAASLAMPGDEVIVHEGIYREWVRPARGGDSEENRIIYRAAEGEDVRILGSEQGWGWRWQSNGLWKNVMRDELHGVYNPFGQLTRHPLPVGADESGDGWGWLKYGRWTHRGDIFINGRGLTEKKTLKEVQSLPFTWHVSIEGGWTIVHANFGRKINPNSKHVEFNVRGAAFFPDKVGLNYISVIGFTIMNVASHWAPPTIFQPGAVGTNGGHHWVIKDNIIIHAKAVAISVGIPSHNYESSIRGHHKICNNVILRCGQAGIMGQSWNSNSVICHNHIEDINYRKEFGGWETAAIKHHNADSLVVMGNFIRRVHTPDPAIGAAHGIWNDYQNSNWQVKQNIVMNTDGHTILVEANWEGPNLFANNILHNGTIGTYSTRGDAWVQNLFVNCKQAWENQPWGNRVQIGNARWFNNMFIGGGLDSTIVEDNSIYSHNLLLDGASNVPFDKQSVISSHPSNVKILENDDGIVLSLTIDPKVLEKSCPIVTSEQLSLPFSFDATVAYDFHGKRRGPNNISGAFAGLDPGSNEIVIYEYSPLYKKALNLIDQ